MSDYWKRLQDPRWQKKRLEILARDEWVCTNCYEEGKTLHVDHGYYEKGQDPWDYPDASLTTLCKDCHELIGQKRLDLQKLLSGGGVMVMDYVIGFAAGVTHCHVAETNAPLIVKNENQLAGLASWMHCSVDELLPRWDEETGRVRGPFPWAPSQDRE